MSGADDAGNGTLEFRDTDGGAVRMVVDEKTGLPVKLSYSANGMNGPAQVEETYSGWRDVQGIKVPFERTVTQEGNKFADVHIRDYKFNSGLTLEQLSKKP